MGGSVRRLALFGLPGSGKSTTAIFLDEAVRSAGAVGVRLKLAEPLYGLQSEVYEICGRPLPDPYRQDGKLLAMLGQHLRRINPTVLTDDFRRRLQHRVRGLPEDAQVIVICDDMRPVDAAAMHEMGFEMTHVLCTQQISSRRIIDRGDLAVEDGVQPLEAGIPLLSADHVIKNDGDIEDLIRNVEEFVKELLS